MSSIQTVDSSLVLEQKIQQEQSLSTQLLAVATSVYKVARLIFVGAFTLLSNTGTFFVGFTAGILFPEQMNAQIEKIQNFWEQLDRYESAALMIIGGFFAFPILSWQASLFMGAWTAVHLQRDRSPTAG